MQALNPAEAVPAGNQDTAPVAGERPLSLPVPIEAGDSERAASLPFQCSRQIRKTACGRRPVLKPGDFIVHKSTAQQVFPMVRGQLQPGQEGGVHAMPRISIRQRGLRVFRRWSGLGPLRLAPVIDIRPLAFKPGLQLPVRLPSGKAFIEGVQVQNAAGKPSALGAAEHVLFEIDVEMPFP